MLYEHLSYSGEVVTSGAVDALLTAYPCVTRSSAIPAGYHLDGRGFALLSDTHTLHLFTLSQAEIHQAVDADPDHCVADMFTGTYAGVLAVDLTGASIDVIEPLVPKSWSGAVARSALQTAENLVHEEAATRQSLATRPLCWITQELLDNLVHDPRTDDFVMAPWTTFNPNEPQPVLAPVDALAKSDPHFGLALSALHREIARRYHRLTQIYAAEAQRPAASEGPRAAP